MKKTGDPIFDYNVQLFDAIFGKAKISSEVFAEIERDDKIEAAQQRRQDRIEEDESEVFDFERDCGARP